MVNVQWPISSEQWAAKSQIITNHQISMTIENNSSDLGDCVINDKTVRNVMLNEWSGLPSSPEKTPTATAPRKELKLRPLWCPSSERSTSKKRYHCHSWGGIESLLPKGLFAPFILPIWNGFTIGCIIWLNCYEKTGNIQAKWRKVFNSSYFIN